MTDQDNRTPAQIFADNITGANQPAPTQPIAQPIDPRTDSIDALHQRTEGK